MISFNHSRAIATLFRRTSNGVRLNSISGWTCWPKIYKANTSSSSEDWVEVLYKSLALV